MTGNSSLNEINRSIGKLQGELKSGFSAVNKRLDYINGQGTGRETRINKLESDMDRGRGVIAVIGAVAGIVASFMLDIGARFFKK